MQTAIAPDHVAFISEALRREPGTATTKPADQPRPRAEAMDTPMESAVDAGRLPEPGWTDAELDSAILVLCNEIPPVRMVACWRALEHCRRYTPRGTTASLLADMRLALRVDTDQPGFWQGRVAGG
jgi:hypothetical protein